MPSTDDYETTDRSKAGYSEIEHTADWELAVWAPDLSMLFEQAARGMYALAGIRLRNGRRKKRVIEIQAQDQETLLVNFLSEILYYYEQERLGFDQFEIKLTEDSIHGVLGGALIESIDKEIKAVTFHNLRIRNSNRGLEVNIVFDV